MSILYDPKNRRVQPWIPIAFLLVPALLIFIGYYLTKDKVHQYKVEQDQKKTEDVLERF